MELNVYDSNGSVVKTAKANLIDIKFGTIRSLMRLLKIEKLEDFDDVFETVYEAWDQLTEVLGQIFPEMNYEDWDNVPVRELLPIVVQIMKYSFAEIMKVPHEKNV